MSNSKKKRDSLTKRYLFKLISNFLALLQGLIFTSLIPRNLGPALFGTYAYLNEAFNQAFAFFDFGSSIGLSTKLAQDHEDRLLLRFYGFFSLLISIIILGIGAGLYISRFRSFIFQDAVPSYIFCAYLFACLLWSNSVLTRSIDALGLTVNLEKVRIINSTLKTFVILFIFLIHWISILSVFAIQISFVLILNIHNYLLLIKAVPLNAKEQQSNNFAFKMYWPYFKAYCAPIAIHSIIAAFCVFMDRWLLQHFYGTVQQGFYSFSSQIGVICTLFTGSIIPLFHRDIARASYQNDHEKIFEYLSMALPVLFLTSAFISTALASQAEYISVLIGGVSFKGALPTVQIMALLPIHQTMGQILGTCFYGMGLTKKYRNIAAMALFAGFILTMLLLNSHSPFQMNNGALALAYKTLIVNAISVHLLLYSFLSHLKKRIFPFLLNQFALLILISASLFISLKVSALIFDSRSWAYLIGFGLIYLAFVGLGIIGCYKLKIDLFLGNQKKFYIWISGLRNRLA